MVEQITYSYGVLQRDALRSDSNEADVSCANVHFERLPGFRIGRQVATRCLFMRERRRNCLEVFEPRSLESRKRFGRCNGVQ